MSHGAVRDYTDHFSFEIPTFDFPGWHTYYDRNLTSIDTILYLMTGNSSLNGAWRNSHAYFVGDTVIDTEISAAFECLVQHMSVAAPTLFHMDRINNPTYWQEVNQLNAAYTGTSTTPVEIGTGFKEFDTQTNRAWVNGSKVIVTSASNPTVNYMWGAVFDYVGGTALTIDAEYSSGSGTHSDWTISLSGERGIQGEQGTIEEAPIDGATYGRKDTDWVTVAATTAASLFVPPYNNLNTNNVEAQLKELEDEKVAKTGGTMTGSLTSTGFLVSGQPYANIGFYLNSVTAANIRWLIRGSDATTANLDISSYNDSGVYVGSPLQINRLTGVSTFINILTYGLNVATTGYFAPGLAVGSTVSTGMFGDGTTLALRGYGNNPIYINNAGGSVTYASFSASASYIYSPISTSAGLAVGGAFTAASSYIYGQAASGSVYSYGPIDAVGQISSYSTSGLRCLVTTAGNNADVYCQNAVRAYSFGSAATSGSFYIADMSISAFRMTISTTGAVDFHGGTISAGNISGVDIYCTNVYPTGNCYLGINGKFYTTTNSFNPTGGGTNACYIAQGTFGGGYALVDGSYWSGLFAESGHVKLGVGVSGTMNTHWIKLEAGGSFVVSGHGFQPGGGTWGDSSDSRIKNETGDYQNGLDAVRSLRPVVYTFKGNDTPEAEMTRGTVPYENSPHYTAATSNREFIGLIAQECETAFPEMVSQRAAVIDGVAVTDMRILDTTPLLFALVNAIKELTTRVEALEV